MTNDERLGPPPVEPLSDAAWSRVERGVWSRMDARGPAEPRPAVSRLRWMLAVPLAVAAAIVAIVIGTRTRATEVAVAADPSRVVSGSAPSSVSFGDVHIELDADTALVMNHGAVHPEVGLERGAAWFTVAPRVGRPAFIVRAGDAAIRVVGTRFRVERSGERLGVDVEHGRVEVQFRGRVVAVGANERWSSEAPAQLSAAAAAPPPVVEPVAPGDPALDAPVPSGPAGPEPSPRTATRRPSRPAANLDTTAEPGRGSTHVTEVDRDRAEYDRLAALEPSSPDAAIAGYLALARGANRWADPSLFAAARLAVDRRDRRAGTLLEIYLQRFPDGANATDARQLLARWKADHP